MNPPKASSAPVGQSSPSAPDKAGANLPTCPRCGYRANSPEDPLAAGPVESRECPACGIVVAKYLRPPPRSTGKIARHPMGRNQESPAALWEPDQGPMPTHATGSGLFTRLGKIGLVLGIILVSLYGAARWMNPSARQDPNDTGFVAVPWIKGARWGEVLIISPAAPAGGT